MRNFPVTTHAERSHEVGYQYRALDRADGGLTVTDHTTGEGATDIAISAANYGVLTVR